MHKHAKRADEIPVHACDFEIVHPLSAWESANTAHLRPAANAANPFATSKVDRWHPRVPIQRKDSVTRRHLQRFGGPVQLKLDQIVRDTHERRSHDIPRPIADRWARLDCGYLRVAVDLHLVDVDPNG